MSSTGDTPSELLTMTKERTNLQVLAFLFPDKKCSFMADRVFHITLELTSYFDSG